ncbi:MAG TPA: FHA domain-containing protein [Solirubrobacteraceae bacterium]
MTTQTSPNPFLAPKPYGPFTPTPERPTGSLEPDAAAEELDALPLLDHAVRRRTRSTMLVARGNYLAMQDADETRLLRLEEKITHLGRGADAGIRLDEHRVSRSHAVLVRHGRHFRILDNRSSNGTFVNGRRITATNLENGDQILVGPVAMQYLVVE